VQEGLVLNSSKGKRKNKKEKSEGLIPGGGDICGGRLGETFQGDRAKSCTSPPTLKEDATDVTPMSKKG